MKRRTTSRRNFEEVLVAARRASGNRFGAPRPSKGEDGEFSIEDLIADEVVIVVHHGRGSGGQGHLRPTIHGARGRMGRARPGIREGTERRRGRGSKSSTCSITPIARPLMR